MWTKCTKTLDKVQTPFFSVRLGKQTSHRYIFNTVARFMVHDGFYLLFYIMVLLLGYFYSYFHSYFHINTYLFTYSSQRFIKKIIPDDQWYLRFHVLLILYQLLSMTHFNLLCRIFHPTLRTPPISFESLMISNLIVIEHRFFSLWMSSPYIPWFRTLMVLML